MTVGLTYLEFLAIFLLTPVTVLAFSLWYRKDVWKSKEAFGGLAFIILLAVTYTTPWDNYLIEIGVWWYGEGATLAHFWKAPLGEYLFFILQPILTGLLLFNFPNIYDMNLDIPYRDRVLGVLGGLTVTLVGTALLFNQSTLYLGAILAWAGPILAIQWGFGSSYLWKIKEYLALMIAVPTLYLWVADRIAIGIGTWVISETYTTGLKIIGLPVEEALFFLVTNIFIVQGLVLYMWVLDRITLKEFVSKAKEIILEDHLWK